MEFFFIVVGIFLLIILFAFILVTSIALGLLGWIFKGIKELFGVTPKS